VYQYATCYASSAELIQKITSENAGERQDGVERFLELLRAGGSDYPMNLLKRAGVDLGTPAPAEAVVRQLDRRVTQLEQEIERL
jgi:oligoendopeptidase F